MPKKKDPDPNEKPQSERFQEFAKEVGADRDPQAVDRTVKELAKQKKS